MEKLQIGEFFDTYKWFFKLPMVCCACKLKQANRVLQIGGVAK